MKTVVLIISVTLILVTGGLPATPSYAGWLVYLKPAFEGRLVDAETGGPIEGAIVAAVYLERYYTPISSDTEEIDVKETVSDKDGRFRFPTYTTIISPLRKVDRVEFIIFKADYASVQDFGLENIFTGKPFNEKKVADEYTWRGKAGLFIRCSPGLVALSKLRTKEDLWLNARSVVLPGQDILGKDSLLRKALDEAERRTVHNMNKP